MENKDILIKVVPDINSFIRLNRFLLTRTKRAIMFFTLPIMFFLLGIIVAITGDVTEGIIFIIISPLFIMLCLSLNKFLVKRNFKASKFYTDENKIIYVIKDNGIEMKIASNSMSIKWEQIYKIYDTNYSLYIMQDNMQSIIIDKKYITENQASIMKALFEDKLARKRYICKTSKNKAIQYLTEVDAKQEESSVEEVKTDADEINYDVTVTTTMTFDAVIKFNYFHLFKGTNRVMIIVLPSIFLLLTLINYMSNGVADAIVPFVIAIAMIPAMLLVTRIFAKRNFKSNKFIASVTDIFYGINEEGITQITKGSKGIFKWSQIYRVYETKDCFYVYISKMQAFVISKADFKEGKLEEAKGIMNNKLTKKQNKLL